MAYENHYEVEYCSILDPLPETSVLFRYASRHIAEHYREDPDGTGYEVEKMIQIALVNGAESSESDQATIWLLQARWPRHAQPSWATIEANAKRQVAQWLAFASIQRAITHFAIRLAYAGRMEGECLQAALQAAMQCPGPLPRTAAEHGRSLDVFDAFYGFGPQPAKGVSSTDIPLPRPKQQPHSHGSFGSHITTQLPRRTLYASATHRSP